MTIHTDYNKWNAARAQLGQREQDGWNVAASEWHDSDDRAVELLHQAIDRIKELETELAEERCGRHTWMERAGMHEEQCLAAQTRAAELEKRSRADT